MTQTFSLVLLIALLSQCLQSFADTSRYVTLQVISLGTTNEFAVASNETAKLVSYVPPGTRSSSLYVIRKQATIRIRLESWNPESAPLIFAGPALVRLVSADEEPSFCTFKITPEFFPPDRTVIVPADGLKTAITLEASTNLVSWAAATNGVYSSTNSPQFFRIRLDRVP
jgi:hypothetical protein